MDVAKAQECVKKMSDEGLMKAAMKIDELAQKDPGYMVLNTLLFSEYTQRPHLDNPFV